MKSFDKISSDQLKDVVEHSDHGLLLDLRKPDDYELEHIAGSVNVPLESLAPAELLCSHSKRPVYLVCTNGKRASQAATLFQTQGFSDLIILAGGILAWRVQGFPLVGSRHWQ